MVERLKMSILYTSGQKFKHVNIIHKQFTLVVKNVQNNVDSPILLFRCIDGIVSLNNSRFIDYFCYRIYFLELELELTDATNTARYTS